MAEPSRFDAEAVLRVSEARYRSLVEASAAVVWTTDGDGRFVEVQWSWQAYTGQAWPDHAGLGWFEMVHPDDRALVSERWASAVAGGTIHEVTARIWHRDTGLWRWCDVRAAPVRDGDGRVAEWVGTLTDVHDRRLAEERAAESAARVDTLLRTAPIGLAFFDTRLRYVMLNDTLAAINGQPVEAHLGRRVSEVLPDLGPESERVLARVAETGEPVLDLEVTGQTLATGGERRDWLVNYFPVRDDAGAVIGIGATVMDVTERKRAEQRLTEERQVVETLNWVGAMLSAELDLTRLVQAVTDAATLLTGAQFGAFFYNVVDNDGESYQLFTISGVPREAFEGFGMPRNTDIFRPTFTGEAVVRLDDVTADPRYGHMPPHHGMPEGHLPVRSYLAVPVVSRSGEVLGGLFFGHADAGVFDERDEQLAVGIAAQAAVGMDNAALYEAVRRAEQRQSLLARASGDLATSLDAEDVLTRLAALVVPALADVCEVDLLAQDGRLERSVRSNGGLPREVEQVFERRPVDVERDHPIAQVLRTGEPQLLRDVAPDLVDALAADDEHLAATRTLGVRQAIVVPLVARGQVIGVLSLMARSRDRRYDHADLELAEDLADRTAVALDNARLYREQREAALILQRSLLPATVTSPPGVQVAARYLPGGEGVEVGGDWYDLVALPSGRIAVAVGDVMGRGIPAAARMGQLRNGLRAYLLDERGPADALTRLEIFADPHRTFVTTICGVLDPVTRQLCIANAGHVPPLILVGGREPEYLDVPLSVPLGTVVGPPIEEGDVTLPPDTTLVLFTDGLVERRDQPVDEGMERLRHVAATAGGQPDLDAFVDALLAGMLGSGYNTDDVAVLAVWLP
jgi:PAS domain S-box-containing protein